MMSPGAALGQMLWTLVWIGGVIASVSWLCGFAIHTFPDARMLRNRVVRVGGTLAMLGLFIWIGAQLRR